jgi:RecA-family ATPase
MTGATITPMSGKEFLDATDPVAPRMAEVDGQTINWDNLKDRIAPPRQFVLKDWIPRRAVTLLHGFGGVGKTLLAQQLGTAAAFNREMLGHPVIGAPVLGWFGEDEHDEIWRRQEAINAALGIHSIADLIGKVFWRPCPDKDITLFEGSTEDSFKTTDHYEILKRQVAKTRAKLVTLDSATQIAALPKATAPS